VHLFVFILTLSQQCRFQTLFTLLPIRHHLVKLLEETRMVMTVLVVA